MSDWRKKRDDEIREKRLEGFTLQQIADEYDMTRERVRQIVENVRTAANVETWGHTTDNNKIYASLFKLMYPNGDFTYYPTKSKAMEDWKENGHGIPQFKWVRFSSRDALSEWANYITKRAAWIGGKKMAEQLVGDGDD